MIEVEHPMVLFLAVELHVNRQDYIARGGDFPLEISTVEIPCLIDNLMKVPCVFQIEVTDLLYGHSFYLYINHRI